MNRVPRNERELDVNKPLIYESEVRGDKSVGNEAPSSYKESAGNLSIMIKGYDISTLEKATKQITQRLLKLGSKLSLVYLPTKREIISLICSPHKHKKSQKHYGSITHRRMIRVSGVSLTDLNFHSPFSRSVYIKVKASKIKGGQKKL